MSLLQVGLTSFRQLPRVTLLDKLIDKEVSQIKERRKNKEERRKKKRRKKKEGRRRRKEEEEEEKEEEEEETVILTMTVNLVLVDETDVFRRTEARHEHDLMSKSQALTHHAGNAKLVVQGRHSQRYVVRGQLVIVLVVAAVNTCTNKTMPSNRFHSSR